ncbi:MAG: HAD family phosphatase [Actinomycetota bacterium]
MIQAVIFDMDGILVNSEPVWERIRRAMVSESGGRWLPDTQQRLMGMSTPEWAHYLTTGVGAQISAEDFTRVAIARVLEAYAHDLPLLAGAVDAVRRVSQRYPVGLASSSPPAVIQGVLERADLQSVFAATAASDEVLRGKPAPDVYLLAAQRLGVNPLSCVAVEDSSNGLRSAAAAGLRVVAIPRPEYPPDPDALALAARQLTSLCQLTDELLDSLALELPGGVSWALPGAARPVRPR